MDEEFLDRVMGADQGIGKVDDFIGQLWRGWKQLRDEGLVQVHTRHLTLDALLTIVVSALGFIQVRLSLTRTTKRSCVFEAS